MGADFQSPPIQAFLPKVNNSVLVVNPTLFEVEEKHFVPVCGIYSTAVIKLLRDPPCATHSCVLDVTPRVPQQDQPCRGEPLSTRVKNKAAKDKGEMGEGKNLYFHEGIKL